MRDTGVTSRLFTRSPFGEVARAQPAVSREGSFGLPVPDQVLKQNQRETCFVFPRRVLRELIQAERRKETWRQKTPEHVRVARADGASGHVSAPPAEWHVYAQRWKESVGKRPQRFRMKNCSFLKVKVHKTLNLFYVYFSSIYFFVSLRNDV